MTPEAVAQAMKVLEIHDKLEDQSLGSKTTSTEKSEKLDDNEVAVLKEMCNVSILISGSIHFLFSHLFIPICRLYGESYQMEKNLILTKSMDMANNKEKSYRTCYD